MKQQILVVDDSIAIRFLLQTVLAKNYIVNTVADGYSAMNFLRHGNHADIIIVSPQLRDMSNWELIEHLTSSGLYGNIPLIVLSSLDINETMIRSEEYGIEYYFTKPFDPIELNKAVKSLISYNRSASLFETRAQLKVG